MRNVLLATVVVVLAGCPATIRTPSIGPPVRSGEPLPALTFRDLEGNARTLDEFKGHVVLLDFWATWCEPCKKSLPLYNAWQTELQDKQFRVVAVSVDEQPDKVPTFARLLFPDVLVLLDTRHEAAKALRLKGMPTAFLLDREGNLVLRELGYTAKKSKALRAEIDALLADD